MSCDRCSSDRVASVSAKCSDLCYISYGAVEKDGYVPHDMGIGGGDYIDFSWCLNCGKIQGIDRLPLAQIEQGELEDE